jgi:hypothetical protein
VRTFSYENVESNPKTARAEGMKREGILKAIISGQRILPFKLTFPVGTVLAFYIHPIFPSCSINSNPLDS